jgi:hypothetical protein
MVKEMHVGTSRRIDSTREVWIGLVGVLPSADCLILSKEIKGAYVNILALAANLSEYQAEIQKALNHYKLTLLEIKDAESLSLRRTKFTVSDDLLRLSDEVKQTGNVRLGTFHEFHNDDA